MGCLTLGSVCCLCILKVYAYLCMYVWADVEIFKFSQQIWLTYLQVLMQMLSGPVQPAMYRIKCLQCSVSDLLFQSGRWRGALQCLLPEPCDFTHAEQEHPSFELQKKQQKLRTS